MKKVELVDAKICIYAGLERLSKNIKKAIKDVIGKEEIHNYDEAVKVARFYNITIKSIYNKVSK